MATNTAPRTTENVDYIDPRNGLTPAEKQEVIARLQALHDAGYDISSQLGQGLELDDNGRVKERGFWSQSKGDLMRIGLLVGAGYLGGGLTGGFAGGAGGAGAAGSGGGLSGLAGPGYTVPSATLGTAGGVGGVTVPTTIGGLTTPGVGTVATTPGVTAGGTAAAGGTSPVAASTQSSFWGKVLGANPVGAAVDIGANLLGNVIQSRQTDKAVQAQIDAANKALDLQKNVYLQQRSDLMPYADMGRGAIGDMGRMTGTSPVSAPTREYFSDAPAGPQTSGVTGPRGASPPHDGNPNNAPVTGQAVPRNSLASLGTSGTVNMLTPDGRPARVPQAQVQAALQAGGRLA